ncbi:MAG: hypothetical protein HOP07_10165 [Bacteriovoracaceae bacterium]|nr:hypothetical protein [Bacteriovoracaceae bacterium]
MKKCLGILLLTISASAFASIEGTYIGESFGSVDVKKCSIKIIKASSGSILTEVGGLTASNRLIKISKDKKNSFEGIETFEDDKYYIGGWMKQFREVVHQVTLELDQSGNPTEFTYSRNTLGGQQSINCIHLNLENSK